MSWNKLDLSDEIVAAMQADRDRGMTYAKIAAKYGISETAVCARVVDRETKAVLLDSKSYRLTGDFAKRWNEARYRIWGIRPGWYDEWNEARQKILDIMGGKR